MSQTKVQLLNPIGVMTAPGVNVSGTLTATTFDGNLVGAAGSIIGTPNANAGIVTAVSFYGDGSNLTGVAGSTFIGVVTAAQSGTTTIDLSLGNIIYFTQDTDTTVAFANTESTQVVDFIRTKDDTTTARTITWPDSIIWNGGSAPTLIDSSQTGEVQIFKLITRDQGVTWYGYEPMKNDPPPIFSLFSWGYNSHGELGHNDIVSRSSPTQIPGTTQWTLTSSNNTSSGTGRISLVKTDGTLWVWGYGYGGKLGLNDHVDRSSPTQLPGTQWSETNATPAVTFATKTDGTLWAWGLTYDGELGINVAVVSMSSPVQIPGTQWSKFSASSYQNAGAGIKTDASLWVWGNNNWGQLGQTDKVPRSSPVQLPGTQWSSISTGGRGTNLALKTFNAGNTGTLWSWGYNTAGVLGLGDQDYRSSPIQVGLDTTWTSVKVLTQVSGTNNYCAGIKSDGTLWMWGYNISGGLGQNDIIHRSSPIQIPGTQWDDISSGLASYSVHALKTDGSLWSWGYNSAPGNSWGALGLNDTIPRSSPTQVPGTNWTQIYSGYAIKS